MPCLPLSKKRKVVQPEDTTQYKNVARYGETQITYVGHPGKPLSLSHWRKAEKDTNSGRQQPDIPSSPNASPTIAVEIETSKECKMRNASTQYDESKHTCQPLSMPYNDERKECKNLVASMPSQLKQPQPQSTQHAQSEFYISVPVFTETLSHSYRKKNQYVYVEKAEDGASLNQSLSRIVHQDSSAQMPPSGSRQHQEKQDQMSVQSRNSSQRQQIHHGYGNEASSKTMSSRETRYSYEHEIFQKAMVLMKSQQTSGLNVDSDDEDNR